MIAEAKIGRGDRAFDYYSRINPSRREELVKCTAASRMCTPR